MAVESKGLGLTPNLRENQSTDEIHDEIGDPLMT